MHSDLAQFIQNRSIFHSKDVFESLASFIEKGQWKGLKEYVPYGSSVFSRQMMVGEVLKERFSHYMSNLPGEVKLYQALFASPQVSFKELNDAGLLYAFAKRVPSIPTAARDGLFQALQALPDTPIGKDFWLAPLKWSYLSKLSPSEDTRYVSSWLERWITDVDFQPVYLAYFNQAGLSPVEAFERSSEVSIEGKKTNTKGYLWQKLNTHAQLRYWVSKGLLQSCPPASEMLKPSLKEKPADDHTLRPSEEEGRVTLIWQSPLPDSVKSYLTLTWFEYALSRTHLKEARRWMKLLCHEKPEMVLSPILWLNGFKQLAYANHNPCDWKAFMALHREAYERLPSHAALRQTHESLERLWKAQLGWSIDRRHITPDKAKHPMLMQAMESIGPLQNDDIEQLMDVLCSEDIKRLNPVLMAPFLQKIRDFIWMACNGFKMASPLQPFTPSHKATWTPTWVEGMGSIQKTTKTSTATKPWLLNQFIRMIANHEMLWKGARELHFLKMGEWTEEDWAAFKQDSIFIPENMQRLFELDISKTSLMHAKPKSMDEALATVVFAWVMHGFDWESKESDKERVLNVLSKEDQGTFQYQLQVTHDSHHLRQVLNQSSQERKTLPSKRL